MAGEEAPVEVIRQMESKVPEDVLETLLKYEEEEEEPEWRQYTSTGLNTGTIQVRLILV